MTQTEKKLLNKEMLPDNDCFGCGHHNPHGLQIEVLRDDDDPDGLKGEFHPPEHMIGFPGITHGGAIYAALDCMAAWAAMALRRGSKSIWILRSATMTYHRPALQGKPLRLSARIQEEGQPSDPMIVHAQAEDQNGKLLSEGRFKVIPLPPEKFLKVAGMDELPDNYRKLLSDEE